MGNPSKIVPSISPYFNQMLNMPVQTKAIVLVTKLTKFNGNMSYTVQEAKAFLKNVIGLSGKPIENFEAKIEAAKIKVAYLLKQKQETDIASKIGNASKAYVAPQIFVK